ncbi:leucine-rich repeat domain-containing protein [Rhizophagus clarus]|uniref:Leucine-rich repeat domain-containing protein n=1 Tax=Rhizophagus clarus TaxID=94130 RepID=A0A8H3LIZ6_9GLOM|nr:leucine-rich repeat domain-containing protein [Rhizophagus clarus]
MWLFSQVDAQGWLDYNYPEDGVYRGLSPNISFHMFHDNRQKRRKEIKALDIWAASNLSGSLKVDGFDNLENFNCWRNSLTELDLRDCSNNKLTELDTSNCPRLEKLICDGNQLRLTQGITDQNHQENIIQNLQTQLEQERKKNKFLMGQLENESEDE